MPNSGLADSDDRGTDTLKRGRRSWYPDEDGQTTLNPFSKARNLRCRTRLGGIDENDSAQVDIVVQAIASELERPPQPRAPSCEPSPSPLPPPLRRRDVWNVVEEEPTSPLFRVFNAISRNILGLLLLLPFVPGLSHSYGALLQCYPFSFWMLP